MQDFVSIWLVPSPEVLGPLQRIVDTVTARNGAQSFLPHLTILSGPANCDRVVESVVQTCGTLPLQARAPITGQLGNAFLGDGDCFHHCLGYGFSFDAQATESVLALTESVEAKLAAQEIGLERVPDPHISLMYLDHQAAQTDFDYVAAQRALLPDAGQRVVLDTLVLVRGDGPIANQQDVADWQVKRRIVLPADRV